MIRFIKAVLHFIQFFSPRHAAKIAVFLGGYVRKYPRKEREKDALGRARKIEIIKSDGNKLIAWSWGAGPRVLIAHGWESRGSQMSSIAEAIAAQGYQAIAIDFTAHGDSEGKRTSFLHFNEDILLLANHFKNEVDAFVGYSAGGISSLYAHKKGFNPNKYVIIASPCAPYPAIEMTQNVFKLNPKSVKHMQDIYAGLFGMTWEELEESKFFTQFTQPALFINSHADKSVTVDQMQSIVDNWGGEKELLSLDGLSHRQLMWDDRVLKEITSFLQVAE